MTMRDTSVPETMEKREQTLASEIEHLYLVSGTILPRPLPLAQQDDSTLPPCPDLSPYVSPFLWSKPRKVLITIISCCVAAMSSYEAGAYTAPSEELKVTWNISSTQYNLGITLYMLAFAVAPMLLAPFSETNGRRPVFIISGLIFTVCLIGCGATESFAGMLVARFFLGIGGSTFSTIVGGVISDIYHAKDRNIPMSCFSGSVFLGTGLGPLITGFIAHRSNWRWIHYSLAIVSGCLVLRKATSLNHYYDTLENLGCKGMIFVANDTEKSHIRRIRWKVQSEEERKSIFMMISNSGLRPFRLLFTEPVVFFFSVWVSFSWGILFLQFIALPLVFSTKYNFNVEQTGAVFSAVSIGSLIAMPLTLFQEWVTRRYGKKFSKPEGRLYFTCIQSILMPAGMLWFGWTSFSSIPWIVPTLAVGCSTIGIFSIYLATFNYLADTYHRYASSAIAAQSFCRNVLAATFPLFTNTMFTNLTYPVAASLLGGIGIVLTIVPWVLVLYGPQIRARSKFASQL